MNTGLKNERVTFRKKIFVLMIKIKQEHSQFNGDRNKDNFNFNCCEKNSFYIYPVGYLGHPQHTTFTQNTSFSKIC